MNVNTITITAADATRKLAEYRRLSDGQRTLVDEQLIRLYRMVQGGARVLNVEAAFKTTGLNDQGQPRLAIARGDWQHVAFHPNSRPSGGHSAGAGVFTNGAALDRRLTSNLVALPATTFPAALTRSRLRSPVPHIPPAIRPRTALRNYHVLFEVAAWEVYPVDPFLLRHVYGALYVVEAEWELTPLEASLLSALTA